MQHLEALTISARVHLGRIQYRTSARHDLAVAAGATEAASELRDQIANVSRLILHAERGRLALLEIAEGNADG